MSLNWNFTGCPSWKATEEKNEDGKARFAMHLPDGSRIPWSVTEALIWATMIVDIGWDIPKNITSSCSGSHTTRRPWGR